MPTKSFSLEAGGTRKLAISWRGAWRDFTVQYDHSTVLTVPDQKALRSGASVTLPDGSSLSVRLERRFLGPELVLTRNRVPVSGSNTDPETLVKTSVSILYFVAGASALLGIAVEVFDIRMFRVLGFGISSIVSGAIFGVLGYFAQRRSRIALGTAIVLFAIDGVIGIAVAAEHTGSPPGGALLVRIMFIVAMVRGYIALGSLTHPSKGV